MSKTNYSKVKTDEGKGIYVRFYKNEKFDKTDPECTQPVGSVLFMLDGKSTVLACGKRNQMRTERRDVTTPVPLNLIPAPMNPRKSQQKPSPVAADDDIPF